MSYQVLFRELDHESNELSICKSHISTVEYRTQTAPHSTVIGRYSVLPFYRELEQELKIHGSKLINSYREHSWVANITSWAGPGRILEQVTPTVYTNWSDLPEGSYVVKGKTNSRKHQWNTHMFAPTREDVPKIARRLYDDPLLLQQGLVARPYIPLKKLSEGINDLPISNEWRTFWLRTEHQVCMIHSEFYWSSFDVTPGDKPPFLWMQEIAEKITPCIHFFVMDVAQTEASDWIVIELNDGQMSGLNNYEGLYKSLSVLEKM